MKAFVHIVINKKYFSDEIRNIFLRKILKSIKNALNKTRALLGFDDNVNRLVSMQRNDREELFKLSVNTFRWRRYLRSCSLNTFMCLGFQAKLDCLTLVQKFGHWV